MFVQRKQSRHQQQHSNQSTAYNNNYNNNNNNSGYNRSHNTNNKHHHQHSNHYNNSSSSSSYHYNNSNYSNYQNDSYDNSSSRSSHHYNKNSNTTTTNTNINTNNNTNKSSVKFDYKKVAGFSWDHDGKNLHEIPPEMKSYFTRTQKVMQLDQFPNDHERSLFIESVLRETVNALIEVDEMENDDDDDENGVGENTNDEENKKKNKKKSKVAKNSTEKIQKLRKEAEKEFLTVLNYPQSSRIIQSLCEVAAPEHLVTFFKHFVKRVQWISTGRFSSFVLDAIMKRSCAICQLEIEERVNKLDGGGEDGLDVGELEEGGEDEDGNNSKVLMMDLMKKMREWVKDLLSEMTIHPQATFFVREYVKVLCTLTHDKLSNRYRRLLISVVDEVLRGTTFKEWLPYEAGVASLVSFLESIPNTHQAYENVIRFVLGLSSGTPSSGASTSTSATVPVVAKLNFQDEKLKQSVLWLLNNNSTVHLLQAIIKSSSHDLINDLYAFVFRNKLAEMSVDRSQCYIVEDLIKHATHREQFELMMKELEPVFGKIWETKTRNVITALAEGCIKYQTKQKEFIKEMMVAFNANQYHSSERQKLINVLLFNNVSPPPNPLLDRFGCQLLATMFKFDAQQLQILLEAFLALDNQLFADMCCDKFGSKVAEALVMSKQAMGSKTKYKIIKKLKGHYARLAKDMFGSHVIEKCMFVCEAKRKKNIAEELVADEKNMRNCKHGIIIWNKCFLSKFKQDAEKWLSVEDQNEKRREMFKEIIEDDAVVAPSSSSTKQDEKSSASDNKAASTKKSAKNQPKPVDPLLASTKNKKTKNKLMTVDLFANIGQPANNSSKRKREEEVNSEPKKDDDNDDGSEEVSNVTDLSFISQAIKKLKK